MANEKEAAVTVEKQPAQPEPTAFPVTLDEYCTRLSNTDKRVELIGAFYKSEVAAGRQKDLEAAYGARLVAFANKPA